MSTQLDKHSGLVYFDEPDHFIEPRVVFSGRFPYSREYDRVVKTFNTAYGDVAIGMWLGGENRTEQQDAVCLGLDIYENLWMVVVDGLGGHPGGAEASQICCDVLKEEMTKVGFAADNTLRDKIRVRMARSRKIMSNPRRIGGACIALVCINGYTHKLQCFSMGDVEVGVLREETSLVLANTHDTGVENNQVTKTLSPAGRFDFTTTEFKLQAGDKILVASDGLVNYAYRAFGLSRLSSRQQIQVAIEISRQRNDVNSDNLSIMCLNSFQPISNSPTFSNIQLEA